MTYRRAIAYLLALMGAAACVTDHDDLAKRPRVDAGAHDAATDSPHASGGSGGTGGVDGSPGRPDAVTLLHGVVDAGPIQFCFGPAGGSLRGAPIPEGGLAYGAWLAIGQPEGVDFGSDTIDVVVFAGELTRIAGLDCSEAWSRAEAWMSAAGHDGSAGQGGEGGSAGADTPPPVPVRAAALARVPARTFFSGQSSLLVASGCIARASHSPEAQQACGAVAPSAGSTLTPVIVSMSKDTIPGEIRLQAVHASVAAPPLSWTIRETEAVAYSIAERIGIGGIAPRVPESVRDTRVINGDHALAEVRTYDERELWAAFPISQAKSLGSVPELAIGNNYVAVLIGPGRDSNGAGFNRVAVTLLRVQ